LPKALKGHGNRGIIVPIMGRIPVLGVRKFSSTADGVSSVSTERKLQKINELCINNKDFIVTDRLYRLLYDKEMYYVAYEKLKSKPGNMTQGITPTTLDGISEEIFKEIIKSLKDGSFQFKPGRRVYIPKPGPLTIAPPRDKLVQECIRMILEVIYEPSFKECSHGFRPNKSCHTALRDVKQKFNMAK
jgi:retron-type reverse transcriptase